MARVKLRVLLLFRREALGAGLTIIGAVDKVAAVVSLACPIKFVFFRWSAFC